MLVHFVSPFHLDHAEPISGIDGLAPDVEDGSTEVLLANLRTWAMGEAPGCTGGVTSPIDGDYARGQECFQQDGAVVPFEGDVRAIASADVHFATTTGLQVIASDGLEVPVTSDDLDTLVGAERAEDARLGLCAAMLRTSTSTIRASTPTSPTTTAPRAPTRSGTSGSGG
jgi:hypothetical protein